MNDRETFAIAVSGLVLLAGIGPVPGLGATVVAVPGLGATVVAVPGLGAAVVAVPGLGVTVVESATGGPGYRGDDALAQYKVSFENVTIETWLLRNATVRNLTVSEVVVRNVTRVNGTHANVTLSNVTVGRFVVERGRLENVTAERLVVRNRSVLNVPGGNLVDPDIQNRTIARHVTNNVIIVGVVIDEIAIDAAVLCGNVTLGPGANSSTSFGPRASASEPAVTVTDGTIDEALVVRGTMLNWSVGAVQRPNATDADSNATKASPGTTNASLPKGCDV